MWKLCLDTKQHSLSVERNKHHQMGFSLSVLLRWSLPVQWGAAGWPPGCSSGICEWREGCAVHVHFHILTPCAGSSFPPPWSLTTKPVHPNPIPEISLSYTSYRRSIPCPLSSDTSPQHQQNDSLREISKCVCGGRGAVGELKWQDSQAKNLQGFC